MAWVPRRLADDIVQECAPERLGTARCHERRDEERARSRRLAGYHSPKTRRPRAVIEPIEVAPHHLLTWARAPAAGLVHEDSRTCLSDELYPDVVAEIVLANLKRKDPVVRATAWLRSERSWRHHLAPLLEGS